MCSFFFLNYENNFSIENYLSKFLLFVSFSFWNPSVWLVSKPILRKKEICTENKNNNTRLDTLFYNETHFKKKKKQKSSEIKRNIYGGHKGTLQKNTKCWDQTITSQNENEKKNSYIFFFEFFLFYKEFGATFNIKQATPFRFCLPMLILQNKRARRGFINEKWVSGEK